MDDDLKLLPCPFCVGEAKIHTHFAATSRGVKYRVICLREECWGMTNDADSKEAAAKLWNTRPVEDALRSDLAAAREDADRLAKSLHGMIITCQREGCNNPAAWKWSDRDGTEYLCCAHKNDHFYENGPFEYHGNDTGLATLTQHEALKGSAQ